MLEIVGRLASALVGAVLCSVALSVFTPRASAHEINVKNVALHCDADAVYGSGEQSGFLLRAVESRFGLSNQELSDEQVKTSFDSLLLDSTYMTAITIFATPDDPLDVSSDSADNLSNLLDTSDTLLVCATYMRIDTGAIDSLHVQFEALSPSTVISAGGWDYSFEGSVGNIQITKIGNQVKLDFGRHVYCGSLAVRVKGYANGQLVDETYNTLDL